MGEAYYYLKAEFNDEKTAKKVFEDFEARLKDLVVLHEESPTIMPTDRPAGVFATQEGTRIETPDMAEMDLNLDGDTILLCCEVWHMTDWEPIAKWLRTQGAKVGWTTESEACIFDCITLS